MLSAMITSKEVTWDHKMLKARLLFNMMHVDNPHNSQLDYMQASKS